MRYLLTPVGWNELLGDGIAETSIIAYKSQRLIYKLTRAKDASLKNKWYQSPLHLFHILVVAVQFLPEHFFFT